MVKSALSNSCGSVARAWCPAGISPPQQSCQSCIVHTAPLRRTTPHIRHSYHGCRADSQLVVYVKLRVLLFSQLVVYVKLRVSRLATCRIRQIASQLRLAICRIRQIASFQMSPCESPRHRSCVCCVCCRCRCRCRWRCRCRCRCRCPCRCRHRNIRCPPRLSMPLHLSLPPRADNNLTLRPVC